MSRIGRGERACDFDCECVCMDVFTYLVSSLLSTLALRTFRVRHVDI